jgi:hypothetical protein
MATTLAPPSTHWDQISAIPFKENRPTKETAQTLRDELLFQRATQTYLWAMPLINTLGMQVGSEKRSEAATTSSRSGKSGSTPKLSSPPRTLTYCTR